MTPRLTHPLDDDAVAMGAHLRRRRHAAGLTLQQLAAMTDLSHSFLSLVERGRTRPSLPSLTRLTRVLGTTPLDLYADLDRALETSATTTDEGARVVRASPPLAHDTLESARTLYEVTGSLRLIQVETRLRTPAGEHRHLYAEFVQVASGRLRIHFDSEDVTLDPGDSALIPPHTAHNWSVLSDVPVRMLLAQHTVGE